MSDFDLMISIAARLNDDRVSLQAEVDRQSAEIERLTRERDEARYCLKSVLHAHASNNAVPPNLRDLAREEALARARRAVLEGEP